MRSDAKVCKKLIYYCFEKLLILIEIKWFCHSCSNWKGFESFIGYLDDDIRRFSIALPKISGYVKTFNENKLMYFCIAKNDVLEIYDNF